MLKQLSNISNLPDFDDHKAVYKFEDSSVGLRGFIAIHNDNLGPATGGAIFSLGFLVIPIIGSWILKRSQISS